jgi:hypothetical protein|tara:strand:- start:349 stop:636 length:288 start_codon:yes stop_codon:yes gene_type:complete
MEFMTMLLTSQPNLEIFQLAQEPIVTSQRPIALTERPQFAMVKEPMESQMSAAHHHSQCAMDFQELMDTQVLIALLHHFQLVEAHTVDFQEETVL